MNKSCEFKIESDDFLRKMIRIFGGAQETNRSPWFSDYHKPDGLDQRSMGKNQMLSCLVGGTAIDKSGPILALAPAGCCYLAPARGDKGLGPRSWQKQPQRHRDGSKTLFLADSLVLSKAVLFMIHTIHPGRLKTVCTLS